VNICVYIHICTFICIHESQIQEADTMNHKNLILNHKNLIRHEEYGGRTVFTCTYAQICIHVQIPTSICINTYINTYI